MYVLKCIKTKVMYSCFLMKNYVKMGNFDILVEKLRAIINVWFLKKKKATLPSNDGG